MKLDSVRIVADFDSTITADNGNTSWSLFSNSGLMPAGYVEDRMALKNHYHPYEIDASISDAERREKMREWWLGHLALFQKYPLRFSVLENVVTHGMTIRSGMDRLLSMAAAQGVPVLILSAGIAASIEIVLWHHHLLSDAISIASNELKFDADGVCIGVWDDHVIHAANKDEWDASDAMRETFRGRSRVLLFGDSLEDIKMIEPALRDSTIAVGFCTSSRRHQRDRFLEAFDIVIESDDADAGVGEWLMNRIRENGA